MFAKGHGHTDMKEASTDRERQRRYYARHRKEILARKRAASEEQREKARVRQRKRYAADPDAALRAERARREKNIEHCRRKEREAARAWRAARPGYNAEQSRRYRQRHLDRVLESNRRWQAAHPDYMAVHAWVKSQKGRPSLCAHCGSTTAKLYDWANVDHQYRRDLNDWIRLCRPCHVRFDRSRTEEGAA